MDIYGIVGSGLAVVLVAIHYAREQERPPHLLGIAVTLAGCNALTVAVKVFGIVALDHLYWKHHAGVLHRLGNNEGYILLLGGFVSVLGCFAAIKDGIHRL